MRALVKLAIFGILVFWVGPSAWHRLSVADRAQINNVLDNLKVELNQLIQSVGQPSSLGSSPASSSGPSYQPTQGTMLMQPGLWSFNASETIAGRTMTASGTQCITPAKVAEMTTGNGQGLIFDPTGGNCWVQQGRQGRQIFANGQCVVGNMSMQISVQMTFDTPQHVYGQMSGGAGAQGRGLAATVDGHWTGGC
jgi:hypothetical protein